MKKMKMSQNEKINFKSKYINKINISCTITCNK